MTRSILAASVALLVAAGAAFAAGPQTAGTPAAAEARHAALSSADQAALQFIHVSNQLEIRGVELEKANVSNAGVKTLVDRLAVDHKKLDETIRKTAEAKGFALADIDIDQMLVGMSNEVQRTAGTEAMPKVRTLSFREWTGDANSLMKLQYVKDRVDDLKLHKTLTGAELDRHVVLCTLAGHAEAIDTLKAWENDLRDSDVKRDVRAAISEMNSHHKEALALQSALGERKDTSGKDIEKEKGEK